jgi:hypothetical protein
MAKSQLKEEMPFHNNKEEVVLVEELRLFIIVGTYQKITQE